MAGGGDLTWQGEGRQSTARNRRLRVETRSHQRTRWEGRVWLVPWQRRPPERFSPTPPATEGINGGLSLPLETDGQPSSAVSSSREEWGGMG